jgi:heme iron utilization protein
MTLDPASLSVLRSLLVERSTAALATLHDGRPFASMIPFATTRATGRFQFVTHVSGLSAHTRDMRSNPDVCLLVMAAETPGVLPQALPRVSISAVAEFIPLDHPDFGTLKGAYLARHPQAADFFQLGDFSIVALTPLSARFVGGFAQAHSLRPEALAAALADDLA